MYSLLRRSANGLADDTIRFAQSLVRTPSPSLGEERVAALIEAKMKEHGYNEVFRDEFGNVVGILYGREGDPTIVLNSHMDTVREDCLGKWTDDPYGAVIRDGKLIGLGAADCKGGIAAQVAAGAILRRSLLPLRGNLVVAATVAEENGASVGTRGLLGKTLPGMDLHPQAVILGEPTSLGMYYGHDGWVELELLVEGDKRDAVETAARAIYDVLLQEESHATQHAPHQEMQVHAPAYLTDDDGHQARLIVHRRLGAPRQLEHVRGQLHRHAQLVAPQDGRLVINVGVTEIPQTLYTGRQVSVQRVADAWQSDPFDRAFERSRQCLAAAGCMVRPGKWHLSRLGMGTAGGMITREFELPVFGYGPGDEEQAHQPNEFVDTSMMVEAAYGTAAIVHGLIGVPVFGWSVDEI
jgi:acetylornithine deacetylase/succinyl-diaminopimelate desuccinylase-like protein